MSFFHQFNAFAASRSEACARTLLERAAASPFSEVSIRHDGLMQAGPNPVSEVALSKANVTPLSRELARTILAAAKS
jgi:hypothetical protein